MLSIIGFNQNKLTFEVPTTYSSRVLAENRHLKKKNPSLSWEYTVLTQMGQDVCVGICEHFIFMLLKNKHKMSTVRVSPQHTGSVTSSQHILPPILYPAFTRNSFC